MEAGKTYYITVEARYWSIQKYVASEQEAIAVQAGKTYTASLEEERYVNYTFTPDGTAVYSYQSLLIHFRDQLFQDFYNKQILFLRLSEHCQAG